MNQKDKQILRALQSEFPITKNPYQTLADRLRITQKQLFAKIKAFKSQRIVRRLGAVISAKHVGYKSVLVAADVSSEQVKRTTNFISADERVSHNYLRDAEFNVWFTYSAPTQKQTNEFINRLKKKPGVNKVIVLPAEKTFKIKAEFTF